MISTPGALTSRRAAAPAAATPPIPLSAAPSSATMPTFSTAIAATEPPPRATRFRGCCGAGIGTVPSRSLTWTVAAVSLGGTPLVLGTHGSSTRPAAFGNADAAAAIAAAAASGLGTLWWQRRQHHQHQHQQRRLRHVAASASRRRAPSASQEPSGGDDGEANRNASTSNSVGEGADTGSSPVLGTGGRKGRRPKKASSVSGGSSDDGGGGVAGSDIGGEEGATAAVEAAATAPGTTPGASAEEQVVVVVVKRPRGRPRRTGGGPGAASSSQSEPPSDSAAGSASFLCQDVAGSSGELGSSSSRSSRSSGSESAAPGPPGARGRGRGRRSASHGSDEGVAVGQPGVDECQKGNSAGKEWAKTEAEARDCGGVASSGVGLPQRAEERMKETIPAAAYGARGGRRQAMGQIGSLTLQQGRTGAAASEAAAAAAAAAEPPPPGLAATTVPLPPHAAAGTGAARGDGATMTEVAGPASTAVGSEAAGAGALVAEPSARRSSRGRALTGVRTIIGRRPLPSSLQPSPGAAAAAAASPLEPPSPPTSSSAASSRLMPSPGSAPPPPPPPLESPLSVPPESHPPSPIRPAVSTSPRPTSSEFASVTPTTSSANDDAPPGSPRASPAVAAAAAAAAVARHTPEADGDLGAAASGSSSHLNSLISLKDSTTAPAVASSTAVCAGVGDGGGGGEGRLEEVASSSAGPQVVTTTTSVTTAEAGASGGTGAASGSGSGGDQPLRHPRRRRRIPTEELETRLGLLFEGDPPAPSPPAPPPLPPSSRHHVPPATTTTIITTTTTTTVTASEALATSEKNGTEKVGKDDPGVASGLDDPGVASGLDDPGVASGLDDYFDAFAGMAALMDHGADYDSAAAAQATSSPHQASGSVLHDQQQHKQQHQQQHRAHHHVHDVALGSVWLDEGGSTSSGGDDDEGFSLLLGPARRGGPTPASGPQSGLLGPGTSSGFGSPPPPPPQGPPESAPHGPPTSSASAASGASGAPRTTFSSYNDPLFDVATQWQQQHQPSFIATSLLPGGGLDEPSVERPVERPASSLPGNSSSGSSSILATGSPAVPSFYDDEDEVFGFDFSYVAPVAPQPPPQLLLMTPPSASSSSPEMQQQQQEQRRQQQQQQPPPSSLPRLQLPPPWDRRPRQHTTTATRTRDAARQRTADGASSVLTSAPPFSYVSQSSAKGPAAAPAVAGAVVVPRGEGCAPEAVRFRRVPRGSSVSTSDTRTETATATTWATETGAGAALAAPPPSSTGAGGVDRGQSPVASGTAAAGAGAAGAGAGAAAAAPAVRAPDTVAPSQSAIAGSGGGGGGGGGGGSNSSRPSAGSPQGSDSGDSDGTHEGPPAAATSALMTTTTATLTATEGDYLQEILGTGSRRVLDRRPGGGGAPNNSTNGVGSGCWDFGRGGRSDSTTVIAAAGREAPWQPPPLRSPRWRDANTPAAGNNGGEGVSEGRWRNRDRSSGGVDGSRRRLRGGYLSGPELEAEAEMGYGAVRQWEEEKRAAPAASPPGGWRPRGTPETTLFVKGLDPAVGEVRLREGLMQLFGSAGHILQVRLPSDPRTGTKGIAYVVFETPEEKARAASLDGSELLGRVVRVDVRVGRPR